MHLQSAAVGLEGMTPEAAEAFARGMANLKEGIDEARSLIRGLHPPILEGAGLLPAIESLVEQQGTSQGREIEFVCDEIPLHLSKFQETSVFRIVQETLTNAVRHSGAKRIRIEVSRQADHVRLEVRDWGRGFVVQTPSNGYGLKGILHRTRALRGTAEIASSLGDGTRITVRFPAVADVEDGPAPDSLPSLDAAGLPSGASRL